MSVTSWNIGHTASNAQHSGTNTLDLEISNVHHSASNRGCVVGNLYELK